MCERDADGTVDDVLCCNSCEMVPEEWKDAGGGLLGGLRCGNCGYTPRRKTRQEIRESLGLDTE